MIGLCIINIEMSKAKGKGNKKKTGFNEGPSKK